MNTASKKVEKLCQERGVDWQRIIVTLTREKGKGGERFIVVIHPYFYPQRTGVGPTIEEAAAEALKQVQI